MKNLLRHFIDCNPPDPTPLDNYPSILNFIKKQNQEIGKIFLGTESDVRSGIPLYAHWFEEVSIALEYQPDQLWDTKDPNEYLELENQRIENNKKHLDKWNSILALKGY